MPFSPEKNLPKGRIFTYLKDPGIESLLYLQMYRRYSICVEDEMFLSDGLLSGAMLVSGRIYHILF